MILKDSSLLSVQPVQVSLLDDALEKDELHINVHFKRNLGKEKLFSFGFSWH